MPRRLGGGGRGELGHEAARSSLGLVGTTTNRPSRSVAQHGGRLGSCLRFRKKGKRGLPSSFFSLDGSNSGSDGRSLLPHCPVLGSDQGPRFFTLCSFCSLSPQ